MKQVRELKVLFITPPIDKWEVMPARTPYPGYAFLGAVLEQHGIPACVLDCNFEQIGYDEMENYINKKSPDVVCVGMYPADSRSDLKAVRITKKLSRDIITVVGGPHVTALSELYSSDKDIDFVVRGEGEYTLLALIQELQKPNPDYKNIPGLAYYENNEFIQTPPRPLIKNLDELPMPAYHLLPMEQMCREKDPGYNCHFMSVPTSRGCPYKCYFCPQWRPYNGTYRARSPELVVDELIYLHDHYGIELVEFNENLMNATKSRIEGFIRLMIEKKVPVKWGFLPRADTVLRDRELIPRMVKAGLSYVLIGVESYSQAILDKINKEENINTIKEAIKLMKDHGVGTVATYIIGWPEETRETLKASNDYLEELDPDAPLIGLLTPFTGSPLWDDSMKNGKIIDYNFDHHNERYPVFDYDNIHPEELTDLANWLLAQQFSRQKLMRSLYLRNPIWSKMVRGFLNISDYFEFEYNEETQCKTLKQGALDVGF